MTDSARVSDQLELGWTVLRTGARADDRMAFGAAVNAGTSGEAYEGLAWAAFRVHDVETMFAAGERAYEIYREMDDRRSDARVVTWIPSDHIDLRRDNAVANGWMRRAGAAFPARRRRLGMAGWRPCSCVVVAATTPADEPPSTAARTLRDRLYLTLSGVASPTQVWRISR